MAGNDKSKGGVSMEDLHFMGKMSVGEPLREIALSELAKGLDVLVIDLCAEWCNLCQTEQSGKVNLWNGYQGKHKPEVNFVTALAQDVMRGDPTEKVLDRWRNAYKIPYPMVLDPQG